jgi:hypothetical protein
VTAVCLHLGELGHSLAAREIRDTEAQQLRARVAEELAGVLVGCDVAAFVVRDEDRDGRVLDGFSQENALHQRLGDAHAKNVSRGTKIA